MSIHHLLASGHIFLTALPLTIGLILVACCVLLCADMKNGQCWWKTLKFRKKHYLALFLIKSCLFRINWSKKHNIWMNWNMQVSALSLFFLHVEREKAGSKFFGPFKWSYSQSWGLAKQNDEIQGDISSTRDQRTKEEQFSSKNLLSPFSFLDGPRCVHDLGHNALLKNWRTSVSSSSWFLFSLFSFPSDVAADLNAGNVSQYSDTFIDANQYALLNELAIRKVLKKVCSVPEKKTQGREENCTLAENGFVYHSFVFACRSFVCFSSIKSGMVCFLNASFLFCVWLFLNRLLMFLASFFLPYCLLDYASTTLWPELERRSLLFNWDCRPFLRVLSTFYTQERATEEKEAQAQAEKQKSAARGDPSTRNEEGKAAADGGGGKVKVKRDRDTFSRSTTKVLLIASICEFTSYMFFLFFLSSYLCCLSTAIWPAFAYLVYTLPSLHLILILAMSLLVLMLLCPFCCSSRFPPRFQPHSSLPWLCSFCSYSSFLFCLS